MKLVLILEAGTRSSSGQAEVRQFDGRGLTIGRGADNDWVLDDPALRLSRRHCVIEFVDGRYTITDTSLNGVYLNGAATPIGCGNTVVLRDGDRIEIAHFVFRVQIVAAETTGSFAGPQSAGPFDESTADPFGAARDARHVIPSPPPACPIPDFPAEPDHDPAPAEAAAPARPGGELGNLRVVRGPTGQVLPPGLREVQPIPVRAVGDAAARRDTPAADTVDCSVFAPPRLARACTMLVQVFAHSPDRQDEAAARAQEFDPEAGRRGVKCLEALVERGTWLVFDLLMPGLDVADPVQRLLWQGRTDCVQFEVAAPSDCRLGPVTGKVTVSRDGVPIGHIKFRIDVTAQQRPIEPAAQGEDARRYQKAFISYASADRLEVLKRVQMLARLHIDVFQDIMSLEPGERWERALYRHIDECDLFLLFWSSAAKNSEWVLKEARYALQRKGADEYADPEIVPVILEGPPPPLPPAELSHLHFNDRILYFMAPAAAADAGKHADKAHFAGG